MSSKRSRNQVGKAQPRRDSLAFGFLIVVGLLLAVGLGIVIGLTIQGNRGSAAGPPTQTGASAPPGAAALEARLAQNPSDADALVALGNAYYDAGDYAKSIGYYERFLALRPDDLAARTDLGTAYYYSGNPDAAIQRYEAVLKVDPKYQNALFNMAVVLLDGKKDKAGAAAAIQSYLAAYPTGSQADQARTMLERTK